MIDKCPTCGSDAPHRHPAIQYEGEVEICTDSFHLRDTPQNKQEYKDAVSAREADRRARIKQQLQSTITNLQMAAFQNGANLIRALAPESERAALAALIIEKGLAVAQASIQTQVAAMRAIAELGPVAGPPMAAAIQRSNRMNDENA